jgi:hypothetical protein
MGHTEFGSTDCIPCAVNSYRDSDMFKCEHCAAGTDGLVASLGCIECNVNGGGNGLKANLKPWKSFVWNFKSGDQDIHSGKTDAYIHGAWMWWVGVVPSVCDVQGTNNTVQICDSPGNMHSIRWTNEEGRDVRHADVGGIDELVPEFECGTCEGGLAYSGTFNYDAAFDYAL